MSFHDGTSTYDLTINQQCELRGECVLSRSIINHRRPKANLEQELRWSLEIDNLEAIFKEFRNFKDGTRRGLWYWFKFPRDHFMAKLKHWYTCVKLCGSLVWQYHRLPMLSQTLVWVAQHCSSLHVPSRFGIDQWFVVFHYPQLHESLLRQFHSWQGVWDHPQSLPGRVQKPHWDFLWDVQQRLAGLH